MLNLYETVRARFDLDASRLGSQGCEHCADLRVFCVELFGGALVSPAHRKRFVILELENEFEEEGLTGEFL